MHTPIRPHPDILSPLHIDNRTLNKLLRGIRVEGERAAAKLKQRWHARQHVTLNPNRISAIAKAVPVSTTPGTDFR